MSYIICAKNTICKSPRCPCTAIVGRHTAGITVTSGKTRAVCITPQRA